MSTLSRAAAAEHWYRHCTRVENLLRDSRLGAALRPTRHARHLVLLREVLARLRALPAPADPPS